VNLATVSLLEGIDGGERPSELQERLESLPVDLETLFWKILTSMGSSHFVRASQFFQIVRDSLQPMTLLDLSHADEDDPEYAIKLECMPQTGGQCRARAYIMQRRLNSCCKGLLGAKNITHEYLPYAHVNYLHRTVSDFLEFPENWEKIRDVTDEHFNPSLRLCNSRIARIKFYDPEILEKHVLWEDATYAIEYAVRSDPECRETQISLLDEIGRAANMIATRPLANGLTFLQGNSSLGSLATHWAQIPVDSISGTTFRRFAALCQLVGYVEAKLKTMTQVEISTCVSQFLHNAVFQCRVFPALSDRPALNHNRTNVQLIKILLDHNADPNFVIEGRSTWAKLACDPVRRDYNKLVWEFLNHGADPYDPGISSYKDRFINQETLVLLKKKRKQKMWYHYRTKMGL
jgi:hypothetical protein